MSLFVQIGFNIEDNNDENTIRDYINYKRHNFFIRHNKDKLSYECLCLLSVCLICCINRVILENPW